MSPYPDTPRERPILECKLVIIHSLRKMLGAFLRRL